MSIGNWIAIVAVVASLLVHAFSFWRSSLGVLTKSLSDMRTKELAELRKTQLEQGEALDQIRERTTTHEEKFEHFAKRLAALNGIGEALDQIQQRTAAHEEKFGHIAQRLAALNGIGR
jgi:archaellum component FlaC